MNARREAEDLKQSACNNQIAGAYARCDFLVWLKNFESHGDNLQAFRKIYQQIKVLKPVLNEISQDKLGDKSLRIDEEEFVLSHFNGASTKK